MKASLRWLKILFVFVFIIGLGAGATYFFLRYKLEKSFDQKIKIISRIPELEVSLAQEDQLLDLLKKRKFFKNGAVFYDQATGWVYPEKLLIILTNEVQSKGRVIGKDENQVYRSYDVGFSDGQYQIFLHWSPLIWQRDQGLSGALTQDVVKSILRVTKKPSLSKKEFLSDQEKEIIKNYSSNSALFEVKKNQNHTWLQKIKKLIISPVWAICSGGEYRCGNWQTQGCYCPGYSTYNNQ